MAVETANELLIVNSLMRGNNLQQPSGLMPPTFQSIITTFAGNPALSGTVSGDGGAPTAAGMDACAGVTVGWDGNVYICDTQGNRIRVVNMQPTTQIIYNVSVAPNTIQTVAGSTWPAVSNTGDEGQAIDATLAHPAYITFDTNHNMYISDQQNECIRMVTTAGIITTVLGGSGGTNLPTPSAYNCPAYFKITAAANASGGNTVYTGTFPTSNPMGGSIVGNNDHVYIHGFGTPANNGFFQVVGTPSSTQLTVNNASGVAETHAANAMFAGFNLPQCALPDVAGNLYVPDALSACIKVWNTQITTQSFWGINVPANFCAIIGGTKAMGYSGDGGQAINAQVNNPVTITFDEYGNSYITDWYNNVVRKVTPAGTISTWAGSSTTLTITQVTQSGSNTIYAYTGAITLPSTYNSQENGIAVTVAGCSHAANNGTHQLIAVGTGTFTVPNASGVTETPSDATGFLGIPGYAGDGGQATSAQLYNPQDVHFDTYGNGYIVDSSNCVIRRVTPQGIISTIAGNAILYGPPIGSHHGDGGPSTSAGLYNPIGCWFNAADTILYISEFWDSCVRQITWSPQAAWGAPTVTGVSPSSGQDTGGVSVTVTGTGFHAGATVNFGSTPATGVAVNSWTSITCTSPSGTLNATVGVTVTNTDAQSGTLANAYTFTAPLPTFVSSAVSNNAATATLDSTGATLLVAVLTAYSGAPTIIDSNNNTWTYLNTCHGSGSNYTRIAYSYSSSGGGLVTGSGHVFTAGGSFSSIAVYTFANTSTTSSVFNAQNNTAGQASGGQPGSITPTAGSLVVCGFGTNGSTITGAAINDSFTGVLTQLAGGRELLAGAYLLNATNSPLNPVWTATLSGADDLMQICIASFL